MSEVQFHRLNRLIKKFNLIAINFKIDFKGFKIPAATVVNIAQLIWVATRVKVKHECA